MLSVAVAGSSSAVQSFAAPILLLTALDLSTFNNNQHLQVTPSLASDPAQSSFLALRLIFPVPMAPQLREKSKATPAKPESSKTDDERELFVEIHSQHVKPDDLWKNLLDTAGLEKVHEHTDQLARVFDFVNLATARRAIVASRWSDFTAGETGSWKLLQKELGINKKDHVDRTETLIRRAYFVRFPERDASKLDGDQMLAEIEGSPAPAKNVLDAAQTSSKIEEKRELFVEIHSQHVKPDDLWKNLLDTAGLEKVHEHTDQLASVFDFVNLATARRAIVALRWSDFTAGETGSWKLLQKELGINEKDHVDRTKTLIRRAYFVRFPERDASVLTDQEMLVALGFPSAAEQIVATPQINWSTEIVQQGFDAEYQGHDLIVIPTLETLQLYAEIHWPAPSFRPSYTLYPSETNTEHDSALFLPNHRNSQGGV
ncbi:hypothetical protein PtA15_2A50 [Puccinia triticina]|uniref:Uncharacterized protein n=1 Tax=Puccinia triticina TaxID=208348 RepID=A0ABY7C9N6_9BASI|nr:uncharacterized protein PtA15_2A50 [Puccinia triticina]WAQ81739.1 hypothetical protein PtA15_2A50 [Puccinia triticina]